MPSRMVHAIGILAAALALILLAPASQAAPVSIAPIWTMGGGFGLDTTGLPQLASLDDEDDGDDDQDKDDDDCDGDHEGDQDDDDEGGSVPIEATSWSALKGAY